MLLRALIVALFAVVASVTGALAHAGLISAEPADGAVVGGAPSAMVLTFTEPVSPIAFSIVGLDEAPAPLRPDRQDGPILHVPLPPQLAAGSYLFSWRVTSEDGHPVNGTVSFAVGAPSGTIAAAASDPSLVAGIWLVRVLQYAALFFGVGSAAFGALAPLPAGVRRVSRGASASGLLLSVPAIGLQGIDLLGLPLGALFSAAPWSEALASPYAQTQALFAIAFVLALLPRRLAAIAAGLAGAFAPTLSGHASTAAPQLLMRGAVFVHLASLMVWLGALLPLFASLRRRDAATLARFSHVIPWVIGALLLSGITLALVQLGPPQADWLSPYGVLLATKLAVVTLLLLLALWNRVRLTSRAQTGDPAPLRRSIVTELVLVMIILGIVAGWRFTPPPRVLAEIEAASAPVTVRLASPKVTASMIVRPARPGPVSLDIVLPIPADSVTVLLENPGHDIATISRSATPGPNQHWHVDGLMLPAAGDWSVAVQARTGKFDLTTLSGKVPLVGKDTMNATAKAAIVASSMLLTAPVSAAGIVPSCPSGQTFTRGDITVTGAFSRATPPNAQSAGGYFTIHNAGSVDDTLVSVSSEAAKDVSIHQMKMNGNVMEMSAVENGLPVPAGGTVSLDPMGYHLMLTGMAAPFVQGQCLDMVLHFAKAGDVTVQFSVGGYAQKTPPSDAPAASSEMSGMDTSGMSSMSSMQGM